MAQINTAQRPGTQLRRPVLRDISLSALLFLAARASVIGMFPFGTAFFAACFDKGIAYIGVIVMCLGLVSAGAGIGTVKYLIAVLLFWIYIKNSRVKSTAAESAVCGLSVLIGGASVLAYTYVGIYDVMLLLTESVASALIYAVYVKAKQFFEDRRERAHISQEELTAVAVCAGIFITGLSGINLPYGISLANIAAVYSSMCIALHSSLAASGSGALCIGFMSAMSSFNSVLAGGLYGLCAIFGNLLKSFGRIGIAVGFIGGAAAAMLCMPQSAMPLGALDAFLAALMFVLTPKKVHKAINIFFSKSLHMEAVSADVRMKEYLSEKLEHAAGAFKSLNECFTDESNKRLNIYRREIGSFLDEMSQRACAGCSMSVKCWQNDFPRTYKSVMSLLETVESEGVLSAQSLSESFRSRCIRSDVFVTEFNHVYELYKKDLIRTGEAVTQRDIVAKQYAETAGLFENIASDILEGFTFREDYEENVVNELDKIGITAFEVSVVESSFGRIEVYLGLGIGIDISKTEMLLSRMFSMPIGLDKDYGGPLMKFVSMPRYSAQVAMRQIKSDESEISGDSVASFETDDRKKYVIIADGMGSGKKARRESRITLKLLREFLSAGFGVETSIEMINSALCLKLENDMFSTIDLLCIDLITGTAEFYKIGAAESLISRSGNIETVFSVSMPAGMIADIHPQGQMKRLSDGDTIIMMSDGISEADCGTVRTEWIKKKLRSDPKDAEALVQDILDTVIEKSHGMIGDDMTAAVVRIAEN